MEAGVRRRRSPARSAWRARKLVAGTATAGAGKNLVDHASARAAIAEVTATD